MARSYLGKTVVPAPLEVYWAIFLSEEDKCCYLDPVISWIMVHTEYSTSSTDQLEPLVIGKHGELELARYYDSNYFGIVRYPHFMPGIENYQRQQIQTYLNRELKIWVANGVLQNFDDF